jgi:hypothetical protein
MSEFSNGFLDISEVDSTDIALVLGDNVGGL